MEQIQPSLPIVFSKSSWFQPPLLLHSHVTRNGPPLPSLDSPYIYLTDVNLYTTQRLKNTNKASHEPPWPSHSSSVPIPKNPQPNLLFSYESETFFVDRYDFTNSGFSSNLLYLTETKSNQTKPTNKNTPTPSPYVSTTHIYPSTFFPSLMLTCRTLSHSKKCIRYHQRKVLVHSTNFRLRIPRTAGRVRQMETESGALMSVCSWKSTARGKKLWELWLGVW